MTGEARILRPMNCVLSGLVIITSAFIVLPISEIREIWLSIALAAIAAGLIAGAGNAINDYSDIDTDRIAHPKRPLPSGMTKKSTVLRMSVFLFIISLACAAYVNMVSLSIAILAILLEIGYAVYLHKSYLGKNIII